jgi:sugar phosphate isomerase/epimerase
MILGSLASNFKNKEIDEALDFAKKLNIEAFEINYFCNPVELIKDKDSIRKFKEHFDSRKIIISAFNCSGNPIHPDKNIADFEINRLEKTMELANSLGVEIVNCFSGCPGGDEASKIPNWITCPWPNYYSEAIKWQWEEKILPFWNNMAKKAKKLKIKFGFEMHPGFAVYNPETFLLLREKIGMEEISCNFDPSHLLWQGINPVVAIRKLGSSIVHVHAKDTIINSSVVELNGVIDWKHYSFVDSRAWSFRTVGYGHGLKFWKDLFSMLRIIKYDRVVSIEHEDPIMDPEEGFIKALNFLKEAMLFKPAGTMWWV